jgi:uncharacterized membrane protein YhaH (DUF805 family)
MQEGKTNRLDKFEIAWHKIFKYADLKTKLLYIENAVHLIIINQESSMSENSPYEAPESDISNNEGASVLSLKEIYLSFEGRIPRKVYWLYGVLGLMIGAGVALGVIFGLASVLGDWFGLLAIPLYIMLIWASLAVQVKRWHDRDKSGWWVLIGLIPLIGPLWQLIECGFLEGTQASNKFGPIPGDY